MLFRSLSYPDDSAGSIMTTEYASLPDDITATEAIIRLRQQAPESETIYYVCVLDNERRLVGIVSLRNLILSRPNALVKEIMKRDAVAVRVDDDREKVAQQLGKYNFLAIPVVDDQHRLVGIVTHDDAMDVVIEEATEDALRMGAVGTMVESILDAPFAMVWRKRAVWLSCLFVAELMTFAAMAFIILCRWQTGAAVPLELAWAEALEAARALPPGEARVQWVLGVLNGDSFGQGKAVDPSCS